MSNKPPTPNTAVSAHPQGFDPWMIASVFGCCPGGIRESLVPLVEFLWGRKLTSKELFQIGASNALRAELSRQLPGLPLDDWRDTGALFVWTGWVKKVGEKVVLCPISTPTIPETCEEAEALLDVSPDTPDKEALDQAQFSWGTNS